MNPANQKRSAWLLAGIAAASVAAVGLALVSQHVYGMEPCPWCILQRVIFLAIALACVIGVISRKAAAAAVIALALAGIASALWQHFQAAASSSCKLTLADRIVGAMQLDSLWPDVFLARASCADAVANLLGVPYDFWSLGLFVLIALTAGMVFAARKRR